MDDDMPGWAAAIAVPVVLAALAYSTWVGIVLWAGGTIPLVGWEVDASPSTAILWFAVLEWPVIGLPVVLALTLVLGPFVALSRRR